MKKLQTIAKAVEPQGDEEGKPKSRKSFERQVHSLHPTPALFHCTKKWFCTRVRATIFLVSIKGGKGCRWEKCAKSRSLTNLQVKLALMTSLGQRNWKPVEFSCFFWQKVKLWLSISHFCAPVVSLMMVVELSESTRLLLGPPATPGRKRSQKR